MSTPCATWPSRTACKCRKTRPRPTPRLRCPLWLFLAATWLGGTITLIFESLIGAGLGSVMSQSSTFGFSLFMHQEILLPLAAMALLALLPLLVERIVRRRRQARPPGD